LYVFHQLVLLHAQIPSSKPSSTGQHIKQHLVLYTTAELSYIQCKPGSDTTKQ